MNIGIGFVMITQFLSYGPMPVSAETITPSIPDPHNKPGKSGQQQSDEIPFPRFWKDPSENIEKGEEGVK